MSAKSVHTALLALAPLALCLTPAFAAEQANTNLYVSATVLDTCIVTAPTALTFATVNTGVVTNQTTQGTVAVACTSAKTGVTLKVEGGDNEADGLRHMKNASNDLVPYQIHSDAGHLTEIGIDGTLFSGDIAAPAVTAFPVYGQIPAGTYAAGIYADTVRVTINY
jgi:spore coat protein U-like protein